MNKEGYQDYTAELAIARVMAEERRRKQLNKNNTVSSKRNGVLTWQRITPNGSTHQSDGNTQEIVMQPRSEDCVSVVSKKTATHQVR